MAREDLHFRLRIPAGLKDRVEAAATHNRRSMTAEIVATLEDMYGADGEVVTYTKFPTISFKLDDLTDKVDRLSAEVEEIKGKDKDKDKDR